MNAHQRRVALRALIREEERRQELWPSLVRSVDKSVLRGLPEYSHSVPTGAKPGKRWLRDHGALLEVGEFRRLAAAYRRLAPKGSGWLYLCEVLDVEHPEGGYVIRQTRLKVKGCV